MGKTIGADFVFELGGLFLDHRIQWGHVIVGLVIVGRGPNAGATVLVGREVGHVPWSIAAFKWHHVLGCRFDFYNLKSRCGSEDCFWPHNIF